MKLLFLDKQDSLRLIRRKYNYESVEAEIMRRVVKPGDTAIDIGAHIGLHTVLLSRLVGPAGAVYAIEPERNNSETLEKNIHALKLKNVYRFQVALGNADEPRMLYVNAKNSGDHRLMPFAGYKSTQMVGVRRGDWLFSDVKKIDFVKMDCQGAEPMVISGMKDTLARVPKMIMEVFPTGIMTCQGYEKWEKIYADVEALGFSWKIIGGIARTKTHGHWNIYCYREK